MQPPLAEPTNGGVAVSAAVAAPSGAVAPAVAGVPAATLPAGAAWPAREPLPAGPGAGRAVPAQRPVVPGERAAGEPVPLSIPGALAAVVLLAVLTATWLIVDPRTPDMAAASYRVSLFASHGFSVLDANWYGGHDLPGYSLLLPPLGTLLGLRAVAALSVIASCVLFARLARSLYGSAAAWGTAVFVLAALGDVWLGRIAFAFGVPFALGATLSLRRGHPLLAAALAVLSAAASPVAGALLGLLGLSVAIHQRSLRPLLALALPPALLVGTLALLFPEGGYEPFPLLSFLATAFVVVVFLVAVPKQARALRVGGLVYLAACVGCLLIRSPMGSNIERYAVLLAGPLLLCECMVVRERGLVPARRRWWGSLTPAAGVALSAIGVFVVWGPVRETLAVAGSEATSPAYYAPVARFLHRHSLHEAIRVEVPLTRSHWETALLAKNVSLARGWDKQLDERYDSVLLEEGLTPASYQAWLHREGVSYVALPDVRPDPSSEQEAKLIEKRLPYLQKVYSNAHWRVYRVRGATPLASGPGRLTRLAYDSFKIHARHAGSFLVRVHYSAYWGITQGSGCVTPGPGGWTRVTLDGPGSAVVQASFSLVRALEGGDACTAAGGS
ncbi:MAG TPA: hypothetical protein VMI13_02290 [Solirubrobacteraceae bacterium]|nr:hypothetical protein [Solirubrobacteraceae bacterium]